MVPIQKIPTELLAEIFDAYADQYRLRESCWEHRDKYDDLSRLMRVPTDLGAVCQDWRNIAFSTPALWRTILLQCPDDAVAIEKVEKHIQKSGDLTLSLYVCENNGLSEEDSGNRPLESFINRYSHRWSLIQLDISQYSRIQLGFVLGKPECRFPSLHRIAIGAIYSYGQSTVEGTAETFPRLTSLALSTLDVFAIKSPWDQLTTLDLHHVDLPEIIFALNHSPGLVHLRIIVLFYQASDNDVALPTNPIVLPELNTLDIMCQDSLVDMSLLLDNIRAPDLKRFRCQTTADVPCPWSKGSRNATLNVLIPSPATSCPDLIIIGGMEMDDDPAFDLDFVQTCAPYSHIIHLCSYQDPTGWVYTRDAIPPLWGDLSHLCPRCLLHEEGNNTEDRHPIGTSFYTPRIGHVLDTPCAVCQLHNVVEDET